jgi:hypothetical protein
MRPLGLIYGMKRLYDPKKHGRMYPPSDCVRETLAAVMREGTDVVMDEEGRMQYALLAMAQRSESGTVRIQDWGKKERLLNVKPYLVRV